MEINKSDKFYILESGNPKEVDQDTWEKWLDENSKELTTQIYFIEKGIIATYFYQGKVSAFDYDDNGKPRLWWITEFDMDSSEYQEIYDQGIRIEVIDFPEIISMLKAREDAGEEYGGTDNFMSFATQEEAIEALEESHPDWKTKGIILEPNKQPPL